MRSLLIFFILFTTVRSYSQTSVYHSFPDSNAYWTVDTWVCCNEYCTYQPIFPVVTNFHFSYFLQGDTFLTPHLYQKVYSTPGLAVKRCTVIDSILDSWAFPGSYQGALREDTTTKRVYFLRDFSSSEILLYDFSVSTGDSMNDCVVTSIDSILIGSSFRRQVHFYGTQSRMIEGIGNTSGLLEPFTVFEDGGTLICFSQEGETLYPDTARFCEFVSSVEKVITYDVSIFPNPFVSEITIQQSQTKTGRFELYNQLGREICSYRLKDLTTTISLPGLSSGIYMYKILSDDFKTASGKLISIQEP